VTEIQNGIVTASIQ